MDDLRAKLIAKLAAAPPAEVVVLPPLEPGTVIPPVTLPEGYKVFDEIDEIIAKSKLPVQPQLDESRCIVCGEEATHGITCRNKEIGGWDHWNVCTAHKDLNKGSEDAQSEND